jgi:hypothetical protein
MPVEQIYMSGLETLLNANLIQQIQVKVKTYCCRQLHQLEDDSWERGFGVNIVEKDKVEIFCMDESGYPKRIDQLNYIVKSF